TGVSALQDLVKQRRIIEVTIAREKRFIAVEDASRYRDALGTPMPTGIAERYLQSVPDPIGDLVLRFARTHGPFTPGDVAKRYGLGIAVITLSLERFVERGRFIEGEFRPGGTQREWIDNEVLRTVRRRSLAKLRKEAEPVDPPVLARLFTHWQSVTRKRRGLDALLEVIESLQGFPMAASIFESEILAARVDNYKPSDLDTLSAAGEIVWTGVEPLGERDGRIALYLTDHLPLLHQPQPVEDSQILDYLRSRGASFFSTMQADLGGFPGELIDAVWDLVWKGALTNDTFHALRAYTRTSKGKGQPRATGFRSRRVAPPSTQGRWSLIPTPATNDTKRANAIATQLLARYGVVTREAPALENIQGGFSAVYPILKAMEEAGRIRRGYFVAGLGATQFATGGAIDLMRSLRIEPDDVESVLLAATDPANPYGAIVKWPESKWTLSRSVGAQVILVNGLMACYITRGEKNLIVFLPEDEPLRSNVARAIAKILASLVTEGGRRAMLLTEINDEPVARHFLASFLIEEGFSPSAMGFQMRSQSLRVAESQR
ncbi:MAG TPA: DEAD/DEAH box helicase, partial [Thermoanaerobaculia bacterium]|nr:DEAD/DEAH box helicase [Thermoanaerobaculia bacterium]